jgi:putative glutamine amidotransferase
MKRILISPFIEINKYDKIVISLNLEWFKYLKKLKLLPKIANPYSPLSLQLKNINCIIISGGGDIYKIKKNKINLFRDRFEKKLIKQAIKKKIPIIAVCRGFQLIFSIFNSNIKNFKRTKNHINKSHLIAINKNFFGIKRKKIIVNSYHNIIIKNLDRNWEKIAEGQDKSAEIAYSNKYKCLGLMFHPERHNKSQTIVNRLIKKFINV